MRQAPDTLDLIKKPVSEIHLEGDSSIFKEKSFSELLDVANLNREEILERVKIVQAKIDDGQSPDEKELEKFNKIKSKLEAGEVDIEDESTDFDEINIKYLNQANIEKLSASARNVKIALTPQQFRASRTSSIMNSIMEGDIEDINKCLTLSKINDNNFFMSYTISTNK